MTVYNFFYNLLFNDQSNILNKFGIIETIALLIAVLSLLIGYFSVTDGRDITTISITKIFKYIIIFLLIIISFAIILYCSFYPVDSGNKEDLMIINTLKISIFAVIFIFIFFLIHDQVRLYFNVKFHELVGVRHPYNY